MAYQGGTYNSPNWVNGNVPAINESELQSVNTAINSATRGIGEMLLTLRTVSDGDYLECDGTVFDEGEYPDLAKLLPKESNTETDFPSGVNSMLYASSPNGNYIIRAYGSTIQYYDATNDTWLNISGIIYPVTVNEWGAIDVSNSGFGVALGIYGSGVGNTWKVECFFDCNTGAVTSYKRDTTGENTSFLKVSCNDDGTYIFLINDGYDTSSESFGVYVSKPTEQYVINGTNLYGFDFSRLLFLKMFENNGAAFAYLDTNGASHFLVCLDDLSHSLSYTLPWITYGANVTDCISAAINDKGETVAVTKGDGTTCVVKYSLNYSTDFETIDIPNKFNNPHNISLNNNGLAVFNACFNWAFIDYYECWLVNIYEKSEKPTEIMWLQQVENPIINDKNTFIATIDTAPLALVTKDGEYVYTSDNKQVFVKNTNTTAKFYMYFNLGTDGELPDATQIAFSDNYNYNLSELGRVYIHGRNSTYPQGFNFVNWQNGITPLSAENLLRLSPYVAFNQLLIGDFLISTRNDLDTLYDGMFIKCSGQTIAEADYPLLYPLVNDFYGGNTLPDFESNGISGVHLYVRAK